MRILTAPEILKSAKDDNQIIFDVEHSPDVKPWDTDFSLWGVAFATSQGCAYITDEAEWRHIMTELLPIDSMAFVCHTAKYDFLCMKVLLDLKKWPEKVYDTEIACNLLFDNLQPNQLGLKACAKRWLRKDRERFDTEADKDSEKFHAYGREDAGDTYMIWSMLKPRLESAKLMRLMSKLTVPASLVFCEMELKGIKWDLDKGRELEARLEVIMDTADHEIKKFFGTTNVNSPKQMRDKLFGEMGIPITKLPLNNTGKQVQRNRGQITIDHVSTGIETMQILANKYPSCLQVLVFRTAKKLLSTYVRPLNKLATDDPHGRIHSRFFVTSATGRTRNSKPNLQNIPAKFSKAMAPYFKDVNIREGFVPDDGNVFLVSDYSNIELRLIAEVSQDPTMITAFCGYECKHCGHTGSSHIVVHECPACGSLEEEEHGFWHGQDLHQITTDSNETLGGDRNLGKILNFATCYGASGWRLHQMFPKLSARDWDRACAGYFATYPYVKKWHNRTEKQMNDALEVRDLFGRRRTFDRVQMRKYYKGCVNQAINFGPQATACHLLMKAIRKLSNYWRETGDWETNVWIVNFIHDEIIVECKREHVERINGDIQRFMESAAELQVPIRANPILAFNWAQGK